MSEGADDFRTGDRVAGYTLLFRLGKGGMGEVWAARRANAGSTGTAIAVKLLRAKDDKKSPMFLDEARTAAALRHPHIVSTFESGVERGLMYIAMELVPGPSLQSLQRATRRAELTLPIPCVRDVGLTMAGALAYARDVKVSGRPLGLIHRDISPHNILVSSSGRAYLSDFGVARSTYQMHETIQGEIRGKPGYMSPEQVNEAPLDQRSDIFCLGIVLWELLTQKRLFKRGTLLKSLVAVAEEPAPDPREVSPSTPDELAQIVIRCLEKDPARRFQAPDELERALASLAHLGGRSESMMAHLIASSYPAATFDVAKKMEAVEGSLAPQAALDDSLASYPSIGSGTHTGSGSGVSRTGTGKSLRSATFSGTVPVIEERGPPKPKPAPSKSRPLIVGLGAGVALAAAVFGGVTLLDPEPSPVPARPSAPLPAPTEPAPAPEPTLAAPDLRAIEAVRSEDLEGLRAALADGGPADSRGDLGWQAIHYAVRADRLPMVRALLNAGANVNAQTTDSGEAPLHLAARYGLDNMVRALLAADADPDLETSNGDTALHAAVSDPTTHSRTTIRRLRRAGASFDARGHLGHSPLMRALVQRNYRGVDTLLSMGARPSLPADELLTAALDAPVSVMRGLVRRLKRGDVSPKIVTEARARSLDLHVEVLRSKVARGR